MRVLLAGCGAMAAQWLEAMKDTVVQGEKHLVGLVDPDTRRADELARKFSLSALPRFTDISTALATLSPDVVFDVTPPAARGEIVRASLKSGAHVLSEKPMANSLTEAKELVELAQIHRLNFAVTQNRRFSSGIRRIGAFLRDGGMGEITGLHADFFLGPHFGGFREEMDHVLLLDMAIHTFDGARYLANDLATHVHCLEVNPPGSWYAHGASAFATFQMHHGAVFTYRGSWCAEGAATSWDSSWRITGTKGTLLWDGKDGIVARAATGPDQFFRDTVELEVPELVSDRQSKGHASIIADFIDCVAREAPIETNAQDNLQTIAMVFAAIESAGTGKVVDIKELTEAA